MLFSYLENDDILSTNGKYSGENLLRKTRDVDYNFVRKHLVQYEDYSGTFTLGYAIDTLYQRKVFVKHLIVQTNLYQRLNW